MLLGVGRSVAMAWDEHGCTYELKCTHTFLCSINDVGICISCFEHVLV